MEKKKKKMSLTSFGAGICGGGIVLLAGILPSLFKGAEGSFKTTLICVAIVIVGLLIHKLGRNIEKRKEEKQKAKQA